MVRKQCPLSSPLGKWRTQSVVPSYEASKQQGQQCELGTLDPRGSAHFITVLWRVDQQLWAPDEPQQRQNAQALRPCHSQPGNFCPTCCLWRAEVQDGGSHLLPWNLGLPAPLFSLLRFPQSSCEHGPAPHPITSLIVNLSASPGNMLLVVLSAHRRLLNRRSNRGLY